MKPEIEVCAYSVDSCIAAQEAGAARVELCTAMCDGGTTPSPAAIRLARRVLDRTQLYVMIRPRGGDFLYSSTEFEQMCEDVKFAKVCGADGVVIGLLNADGSVDKERTTELVRLACPMGVTFHRAFDMVKNYHTALEEVIDAGCCRILTSGLRNLAPEGIETIRELVKASSGRIEIMAGSGVNAGNACELAETGINALHLSGKSTRESGMIYRNPDVSMGGNPGMSEYGIVYADAEKIKAVAEAVRKCL